MSIIEFFIALIAPHVCTGCAKEGAVLCEQCRARLDAAPSSCYRCGVVTGKHSVCSLCRGHTPLKYVWVAAKYKGWARQTLHRLKYERASAAADDIAAQLAQVVPAGPWVVTHAPTTPQRVRQRGYDQAELIARALARRLECPALTTLERRTDKHQVGQSGTVRRTQMADAFAVVRHGVVQNTNVLIIDDVLTTGSTLEAAAHVLKAAGARSVQAAVFARA